MRREVYIVGSGGQGVVLMGALLAEAYALKNWNVVQTVVYDAAQRGGLARAEVVMSDTEFITPRCVKRMWWLLSHLMLCQVLSPR